MKSYQGVYAVDVKDSKSAPKTCFPKAAKDLMDVHKNEQIAAGTLFALKKFFSPE